MKKWMGKAVIGFNILAVVSSVADIARTVKNRKKGEGITLGRGLYLLMDGMVFGIVMQKLADYLDRLNAGSGEEPEKDGGQEPEKGSREDS